jgi:PAS domain S-box-containing protein
MDARHCQLILDSVSDAIVTVGHGFAVKSWNRAAERLFGFAAAEAAGKSILKLLSPEFPGSSRWERFSQLIGKGRLEFDMLNTARGGERMRVLANATLMRDGAGRICGCAVVMRPVEPNRAADGEFARRERHLEAGLDAIGRLHRIGTIFIRGEGPQALLEEMASAAMAITHSDMCDILLEEEGTGKLRVAAQSGGSRPLFGFTEIAAGEGAFGFAAGRGARLTVEDVDDNPAFAAPEFSRMREAGIRSLLCTPLVGRSGEAFGAICTYRRRPGPLDGNELQFLDILTCQVSDILERGRAEDALQGAMRELLERKAAVEADLAAINRLHGISTMFVREEGLQALLDEIVGAAMEFTGAGMGAILAADKRSESLGIVAQKGLTKRAASDIERMHSREHVFAKVMALGGRLSVECASDRPASMCERGQEAMAGLGIQAFQGTQLMSRSGRMLGLLSTFFASPHKSTGSELRMLDMLARLAADIMERSQAEAELQRSNRNTELLYEVVEKLLVGTQTQSAAQEICEKVMGFLGCGVFFNYLFTADKARLRLNACAGLTPEQKAEFEWLERGQAVCGCVADEGCRIVVEYVQKGRDKRADMLRPMGVRAYACHPLVAEGEVLGTLAFGTLTRDTFTAEELALMRAVCGHVAVAMNRMRSVADLKRLSEELRDKNRLVTDFFTNISHEFKTPLSIILVDLQLMEYRLKGVEGELGEKLGRSVAVMRQNALRLLRLIGNLLDVTKIDAGFMSARLIDADAVEVVRGIAESVGDYARDAGLEVRFESDRAGRRMPLDVEKMERILLNLLSNAIKHTPAGGHILVSFKNAPDRITLCVRDDGEGIPEDRREIIFDRFRQVNTKLTRASEGCGIGLSLTRALVELLRGRIWLESAVGRGSEFFVELPVLPAESAAQPVEIDGMPRSRKVEMEFSDIHKVNA